MDAGDWDRLPDRFGLEPAREAERRAMASAVRRAVDEQLTPRQRQIFVAIVLDGVPLDALAVQLSSTRNAIYKTMFDARRKLRALPGAALCLIGSAGRLGLLPDEGEGHARQYG